eukprot:augustus_masked-scaffold_4-processed-gene-6.55-mRNA-1 protein AED:1.00 eAED:1.00 QI:0/0/0/0/1/1/3/0/1081
MSYNNSRAKGTVVAVDERPPNDSYFEKVSARRQEIRKKKFLPMIIAVSFILGMLTAYGIGYGITGDKKLGLGSSDGSEDLKKELDEELAADICSNVDTEVEDLFTCMNPNLAVVCQSGGNFSLFQCNDRCPCGPVDFHLLNGQKIEKSSSRLNQHRYYLLQDIINIADDLVEEYFTPEIEHKTIVDTKTITQLKSILSNNIKQLFKEIKPERISSFLGNTQMNPYANKNKLKTQTKLLNIFELLNTLFILPEAEISDYLQANAWKNFLDSEYYLLYLVKSNPPIDKLGTKELPEPILLDRKKQYSVPVSKNLNEAEVKIRNCVMMEKKGLFCLADNFRFQARLTEVVNGDEEKEVLNQVFFDGFQVFGYEDTTSLKKIVESQGNKDMGDEICIPQTRFMTRVAEYINSFNFDQREKNLNSMLDLKEECIALEDGRCLSRKTSYKRAKVWCPLSFPDKEIEELQGSKEEEKTDDIVEEVVLNENSILEDILEKKMEVVKHDINAKDPLSFLSSILARVNDVEVELEKTSSLDKTSSALSNDSVSLKENKVNNGQHNDVSPPIEYVDISLENDINTGFGLKLSLNEHNFVIITGFTDKKLLDDKIIEIDDVLISAKTEKETLFIQGEVFYVFIDKVRKLDYGTKLSLTFMKKNTWEFFYDSCSYCKRMKVVSTFGGDLFRPDFGSFMDSVIEPPLPQSMNKTKVLTLPKRAKNFRKHGLRSEIKQNPLWVLAIVIVAFLMFLMLGLYVNEKSIDSKTVCINCCSIQFFLGRIITGESRVEFDFSDGSYEELPSGLFQILFDLGALKAVQSVTFEGSSLKNLKRTDFHGESESFFPALEVLDFSSNNVETIPRDAFEDLGPLVEINLSDNPIKSLPSDVFSGQTPLENLVLNGNEEMNLKSVFAASSGSVQALFLQRIGLSDMLQFKELVQKVAPVDTVSLIDLRDNSDVKIIPGETFSSDLFPNLEKIVFAGLSIETLPSDLFIGNEDRILGIDLSSCQNMEKLPDIISGLSSLSALNLRFSGITQIDDGFFKAVGDLKNLDLGCTPLGDSLSTDRDVLVFLVRVGLEENTETLVLETKCDSL